MDDQRFDEYLKSKLANYEEPGFEQADLSALHTRLDAVTQLPWYKRYGYQIITLSALAGLTIMLLMYVNQSQQVQSATQQQYEARLAQQRDELKQLRHTLDAMRLSTRDTIWIEEKRTPDLSRLFLLERIASLEKRVQEMQAEAPVANNESVFIDSIYSIHPSFSSRKPSVRIRATSTMRAEPDHAMLRKKSIHEKNLSANSIREMERHYWPGIGINIGPTVETSKGFYQQADGTINGSIGILADFILSPSISVETGVKHVKRYYEVDDLNETDLPDVDQSLGEFEVAEIDSWAIEIPINLKYRYPITTRTYWLAGLGYSCLFYYKQVFEYDYRLQQGSGFTLGSVYENNQVHAYPGTLNVSFGFDHILRNRKILEASLYYQHGLGEMGLEGVTPRYLGLRGVYWFRVK